MSEQCRDGGPKKANGNCTNPDPIDGLPVQCVGPWAPQKHHFYSQYIEKTSETRQKYLRPTGGRFYAGGAAVIDLFAGPGRARIRSTGEIIDGSPLIALKHIAAPFTRVILCARRATFGMRTVRASPLAERLFRVSDRALVEGPISWLLS